MRAKKESLLDGYPGKQGAIRHGLRDPSSQHFSVEPRAWRRLTTVEWLVARMRLLISGSSLTASRVAEPLLDSLDSSGAFAQVGVGVAAFCRCFNVATPSNEDDSS
ncbi:hypothetical protein RB195_024357 [Necator americanus]